MPQPQIRIAIIGTGLIGPRHARSVVKCSEASLACLVDPSPAAQQVAAQFNAPLCASVAELIKAHRDVDAAIVCTPNNSHVGISRELLNAGIHVLVEKPISVDIASGRELVTLAQSSDAKLLVGHHRRFNPFVAAAKRTIDQGVIGRPIAVSGIWALHKPASYFEPPTEWRANRQSGGASLINLIHEIDILQYLFGPIARVHAENTIKTRDNPAEEGAAILLRFASGVVGTFILSDSTPSPHNFESGTGENPTIPRAGKDFYRIFGTEGTLSVGDMKLTKHAAGEEKSWTSPLQEDVVEEGNEVPFDEQINHFVNVIRGKEEPRCSGEDGLRALVVIGRMKKRSSNKLLGRVDKNKNQKKRVCYNWHRSCREKKTCPELPTPPPPSPRTRGATAPAIVEDFRAALAKAETEQAAAEEKSAKNDKEMMDSNKYLPLP